MRRLYLYFLILSLMFSLYACLKAKDNSKAGDSGSVNGSQVGNVSAEDGRYAEMRARMVKDQIVGRNVKNRLVIDSMLDVPRHLFVSENLRKNAYDDNPLPIGKAQTISQPYIVALMTELLEPDKEDGILEIGTGSGYQAAILAGIVDHVYTIEIIESLARTAEERLGQMGYSNITVKYGDGYQGWKEHAPFDGIIVTAAPDHIPQPLIDQLGVGGRMVIPVGSTFQELKLITKKETGIVETDVIPVRFVPMTGEAQEKEK